MLNRGGGWGEEGTVGLLGLVHGMALPRGGCTAVPQPGLVGDSSCPVPPGQRWGGALGPCWQPGFVSVTVLESLRFTACPAPLPSAAAPTAPLFARELAWRVCRFGSVRKTNFDHLCSVSVILKLVSLLILPLLLASHCK